MVKRIILLISFFLALVTPFLLILSPTKAQTVQPDVSIYPGNNGFTAKKNSTGETFSDARAWKTIQHGLNWITSGTIQLETGVFPLGEDQTIAPDSQWVSKNSSVTVTNTSTGMENTATEISIPYPAPSGLVACYTFPDKVDLKEVMALGFWFRPSLDLSSRSIGYYAGSPVRILLDNTTDCTSPEYSQTVYHPEWVTATWKWYRIPGTPSMSSLPTGLTSISSVGIEIYQNTNLPTPTQPYSLYIDDLHTTAKAYLTLGSNKKLIGAGADKTTLRLNNNANIPAVFLSGSGSEIAYLEIDGNVNNQQSIDQGAGIYNSSGSSNRIHHNYIHHTKGSGLKVRGGSNEIFENHIYWTENAQVEFVKSLSGNHVYNNTLKYAFNDDNIWVRTSSGHLIEKNDIYGIDQTALAAPDKPNSVTHIGGWNGIRVDGGANDVTVTGNRLNNIGGYAIAVANGGSASSDTTRVMVKNNRITGTVSNGISVMPWGGSGNITDIHLIGNLVENGQTRGINVGGSNNEAADNWTRGNLKEGLYLTGTGHFGSGNYIEDQFVDGGAGNNVQRSATAPEIPTFSGGAVSFSPSPYPPPASPTPLPIQPSPTPTSTCQADINTDGMVDLSDFSILASQFLKTGTGLSADINQDGIVDLSDFSILASEFLKTCR